MGLGEERFYTTSSKLHTWDTEVYQLIKDLNFRSPYENAYEAYWRTLCFNGGIHEPAPPETSKAFWAWQHMLRDMSREKRASKFSARSATFPTTCLILVNLSFIGWGIRTVWRRHISIYDYTIWVTSWIIVYSIVRRTIALIACALDPKVIPDLPSFRARLLQLTDECKPFEQAFGQYTICRRFCITEQGYIGWVSLAAREGDEVATFFGTRILFSLRRENQVCPAHG